MASIIRNIRQMHGVGVLADRSVQNSPIGFLRTNLIYGFNGSGKSTLTRLFASLQAGIPDERLPIGCTFEVELDDGSLLTAPDQLSGLEQRLLVFNADFIERNLQWAAGKASPVFYIGREQAKAAESLAQKEAELPTAKLEQTAAQDRARSAEQTLSIFKRERARLISEQARLRARSYEAPQLERDFATLDIGEDAVLNEAALEAARSTCRLDEAMSKIPYLVAMRPFNLETMVEARELAIQTPAFAVLEDLERHPDMVLWVKQGADYHNTHGLDTCLFCDSPIRPQRRIQLEEAFDARLEVFLARIRKAHSDCVQALSTLSARLSACPPSNALLAEFRAPYNEGEERFLKTAIAVEHYVSAYLLVLNEKRDRPTKAIDISGLPDIADVSNALEALDVATEALNNVLTAHNMQVENFRAYQETARLAVRRHYLAIVREEYAAHVNRHKVAIEDADRSTDTVNAITKAIRELHAKVREHGPAAEKINKLIEAYLGHNELTISAVTEGYEIHRHGSLLRGQPSEGEKTAIALCYFLSILDAGGRSLRNRIIVIDDPISSLDTKALNYACSILRVSINDAAQVFILTHNLQVMNEFKKYWKNAARSDNSDKEPTARLLFVDVTIPKGKIIRNTNIVEMSKLLKEYDFEYHYLFHHVLQFLTAGHDYEYAYMMPNVLRRVLDVFLAFKCPGSAGLTGKIEQLCKANPALPRASLVALDRLVQAESHSDSLDDLITFSSMTVEESRRAAEVLVDMMHSVDPHHVDRLMGICRNS